MQDSNDGAYYFSGPFIQHNGWIEPEKEHAIREFQAYLRTQVRLTSATVLAEEFSEDAMALSSASISTVEEIARGLKLRHLFCDPGKAERLRLGISTDVQRESYWLERLRRFETEKIIFVCGDRHVATFSSILVHKGWKHEVLSKGWGRALNPNRGDAS